MAAGNYVSPTGGAGDARQFSIFVDVPIVRNLADGPDEIRRVGAHEPEARRRLHQDPRHRRCALEGRATRGQQYTQDEMHVAVEEAARWGRHVAAHVHGTDGIKAGHSRRRSHGRSRQHDGRRSRRADARHITPTSCRRCTRANRSPRTPNVPDSEKARSKQIAMVKDAIVSARPESGPADRVRNRRRRRPARPERARIRLPRAARPVADGGHHFGDPDGRRDHRLERSRRHDRSHTSSPI